MTLKPTAADWVGAAINFWLGYATCTFINWLYP